MKMQSLKRRVNLKYTVSDEVLDRLVDLFHSWGIREQDWILATENGMQRCGYFLEDPYNRDLDIGIRRHALPWKTKQSEWTCMPPRGSKWFRDYETFGKETDIPFQMVSFPFGPMKVRDIQRAGWYTLPSRKKLHVYSPLLDIEHRIGLLTHPKTKEHLEERIPRWRNRVEEIRRIARRKGDRSVVRACEKFFKLTDGTVRTRSDLPISDMVGGTGVGKGIIKGYVRIIHGKEQFKTFKAGEVLVTEDTNPIFLPLLRKAFAVVTDRGGLTSHAATLAREFGIPAVTGTQIASKVLRTGDMVEVDADRGIVTLLQKS